MGGGNLRPLVALGVIGFAALVAFATLTIGRTLTTPSRPEELMVAASNGSDGQTIHVGRAAEVRGRKERTS
jgi:hypothetical protein